jgi:hypothetical protein
MYNVFANLHISRLTIVHASSSRFFTNRCQVTANLPCSMASVLAGWRLPHLTHDGNSLGLSFGRSVGFFFFFFFLLSESELLYNWLFTSNQFVLAPSRLRLTTRIFFQLSPCSHNPYVTSSLTKGWVCLLWIDFVFFKCTYRTYNMLLKILPCALYTSPLSVPASQSRSCLPYVSYATTVA